MLALPAQADVFDDCVAATARGDKPAAVAATASILELSPAPEVSPEVLKCLEYATGEQHFYIPTDKKIMSRSQLQASLDANIKSLVNQAETWQEEVRSRSRSACKALYKKDADAAVLNPICYDLFMIGGLPD